MDASERRQILKSGFALPWNRLQSDRRKGVPHPPVQKPAESDGERVDLPPPDAVVVAKSDVHACLADRCSRRKYANDSLRLGQLSYLLWATQGVKEVDKDGMATLRTVPSAGARHAFETYLSVHRVHGLQPGVYRYLPLEHKLLHLSSPEDLSHKINEACLGQNWAGDSAVVFIWACVIYRCEWNYLTEAAKLVLLDAGHVAQNLYVAAEALGCGTCGIAAYDQQAFDALLGLDGEEEMVIYLAPLGRV
jgi:SagB-type dehydrogenase family enzyme